jgi:hypothetical protein
MVFLRNVVVISLKGPPINAIHLGKLFEFVNRFVTH